MPEAMSWTVASLSGIAGLDLNITLLRNRTNFESSQSSFPDDCVVRAIDFVRPDVVGISNTGSITSSQSSRTSPHPSRPR